MAEEIEESSNGSKKALNLVIGIFLPILLIIGGYLLFKNEKVYEEIFKNIGVLSFIIVVAVPVVFVVLRLFPQHLQNYIVFLIVLIAILCLILSSIIEQHKDTLFDPKTIKFLKVEMTEQGQSVSTTIEPTKEYEEQLDALTETAIPVEPTLTNEEKVIEYIDNVNQEIIIGLGDTSEKWRNVEILFCSTKAKENLKNFYFDITGKYGGAPIRLTSFYSVKEVVNSPKQNQDYIWEYAQIEKWDYLVYQNLPKERTDSVVILVNYKINQIGDDHFCVYDYSTMDPDKKYLIIRSE